MNELAASGTVKRCVVAGLKGLATPEEAAAAAEKSLASSSAAGCTECNALVVAPARTVSSSSSSSPSPSPSSDSGGYGEKSSSSSNDDDDSVKLCPSTPGVWYVDTLPLKVPSTRSRWCDDDDSEAGDGGAAKKRAAKEKLPQDDAFAAFAVSAGSEVDVAFFDIVQNGSSGAPSA